VRSDCRLFEDTRLSRVPGVTRAGRLAIFAIGGCLALGLCFVSANLHPRFEHRAETIHNQLAILAGAPHVIDGVEHQYPQFQSRVLFPLMLEGAGRLSVLSISQWYLLLRLATACIALWVFLAVCIGAGMADVRTASMGAGTLAYALVFTFNHGWEMPTDFLDVGVYSLALWLALRRRRLATAALVAVATLNHQTAAFVSIVWWSLWAVTDPPRRSFDWSEAVFASALALGSYTESTVVKVWLGSDRSVGYVVDGWRTVPQLIEAIRHPQPFAWPVLLAAMWCPVLLWIGANRAALTGVLRRLMWAVAAIIAVSSPIAFWAELRSVFLAPIVIASFVAVAAEVRAKEMASDCRPAGHPAAGA